MTHFRDFEILHYHGGPMDADEWDCPVLAVGWLERDEPFPTGPCPHDLLERVAELREQFGEAFPGYSCRGLHQCSLCEGNQSLDNSHINLFIPGDGVVYVAPGRIDHHIATHAYAPPQEFIDAVRACLDPRTSQYAALLFDMNHQQRPPLYPERWHLMKIGSHGERIRAVTSKTEAEARKMLAERAAQPPGILFAAAGPSSAALARLAWHCR